jgi:HPt (histidine-containing phosphotransfer) domain-containing protein
MTSIELDTTQQTTHSGKPSWLVSVWVLSAVLLWGGATAIGSARLDARMVLGAMVLLLWGLWLYSELRLRRVRRHLCVEPDAPQALAQNQRSCSCTERDMIFDLHCTLSRLEDDQELFATMVELFLRQQPRQSEELHRAIEQQDREHLLWAIHLLLGMVGQFDAPKTHSTIQRLLRLARSGQWDALAQAATCLDREIAKLRTSLASYVPGS